MLRRLSADELAEFQANMTPARLGEFKICLAMVELSKDLTEDCRAAATLRRLTISLEEFISWIIEECEFAQLGLFAKIQAIIAKPREALTVDDLRSLGTPFEHPTDQACPTFPPPTITKASVGPPAPPTCASPWYLEKAGVFPLPQNF